MDMDVDKSKRVNKAMSRLLVMLLLFCSRHTQLLLGSGKDVAKSEVGRGHDSHEQQRH
jgi:hypothetical protein